MSEPVTTASLAADNPTPAAPAVARQPVPTSHDNQTPQNPYSSPGDRWGARSAPQPAAPRPGVIEDRQYEALSPEQRNSYARVRKPGPDGGSEWIERSKLTAASADPSKSAAPGERVKIGDFELSRDDVAMLMQQKAAADLKATQVPADASGYEPKLPDGLQLPQGIEFKVDPSEPAFDDLRAVARKIGLTQSEFSDILAIHVSREAANEAKVQAAAKAELEKLGSAATMRVTAVDVFIRGLLGDDLGGAMKLGLFTEKQVRGWELVMQMMSSQGAASFSQAHREPASAPGRYSEEQWAEMSQGERWEAARQYSARQRGER